MTRFAVLCTVAVLLIFPASPCPIMARHPESATDGSDHRESVQMECRVCLGRPQRGLLLELTITDPKLINQLIEKPLERVQLDRNPATHVVIGTVKLKEKDDSETGFFLFAPWGHFKQGEKYMTTDFSELKKAFKEAVEKTKPFRC